MVAQVDEYAWNKLNDLNYMLMIMCVYVSVLFAGTFPHF